MIEFDYGVFVDYGVFDLFCFFNDLDIAYRSYTDCAFSFARPFLFTSASCHHLLSSFLMRHHPFVLCSLRSRVAPCSPHPAQSTCRGWEPCWKPCRHQRRPAAPVRPTTSCIPHAFAHKYTPWATQNTLACIHISCLLGSATAAVHSWWSLMLWKTHTQMLNRKICCDF